MRLGFTGTQKGMTSAQKLAFRQLIIDLNPDEFHHGDCIGADAQAHRIFWGLYKVTSSKVILHPPLNNAKRAFCTAAGMVKLSPLPYLERNKEIVINSDVLIATPGEKEEQIRSGTWSTVRFARKQFRPIHLIFPDGSVTSETK